MTDAAAVSWPALLALGAGHGINPAMGWLFAVALGLQRGSRRAVWASLGPLALGHAGAIAAAILIAGMAGLVLSPDALRWGTAALLVGLGGYRLLRASHITYGGMRANGRELAAWSFLMATAHGAGLMLVPALLPLCVSDGPLRAIDPDGAAPLALAATAVHVAATLAVTGVIAFVVYRWVGLAILRSAWINFDSLWTVALLASGALLLFV